jgi:predicted lactoylglutathione lyase
VSDRELVVCLPIQDRRRAHAFFTDGLGFSAVGPRGSDGIPEPLQLHVSDGVRIMLIPSGGFAAIAGGRTTAGPETSECVLTLPVADPATVSTVLDAALAAGATLVTPAAAQPWGFVASFTDLDGHLWMLRSE